MALTPAEERKIIDGLTTFIDVIARSIAEHSARVAAEDFQGTPPKRKVERELAKVTLPTGTLPNTKYQNLPHLIPVTK